MRAVALLVGALNRHDVDVAVALERSARYDTLSLVLQLAVRRVDARIDNGDAHTLAVCFVATTERVQV